ncbi:hypothetical protein FUA48_10625 [Flavobacterium alkalisoli]|uniref:Uncharacterized protein n=1 Tax=Flavobacterium alkalisoli TaxID=2602769 RepID=A0A5B9FZ13_9FLAO|nr:hypothetical protein [Flavobacterium alkalisoli]QEE50017.1 hypothetical protein FUA48_10625 [Flavobacterium alkalisoli]
MSVSASIGFGLWKEQSFSEIIKLLLANGWEASYHGRINYSVNDYNYLNAEADQLDEVLKLLDKESSDSPSITLINTKIKSGGELLHHRNSNFSHFSLTLSVNRIVDTTTNLTDFKLYLEQLQCLIPISQLVEFNEIK